MTTVGTTAAKRVIAEKLEELELPYEKLTARTISFEDLARMSCVFVMVHGWHPNPAANDLKQLAIANGFRVQFTPAEGVVFVS